MAVACFKVKPKDISKYFANIVCQVHANYLDDESIKKETKKETKWPLMTKEKVLLKINYQPNIEKKYPLPQPLPMQQPNLTPSWKNGCYHFTNNSTTAPAEELSFQGQEEVLGVLQRQRRRRKKFYISLYLENIIF